MHSEALQYLAGPCCGGALSVSTVSEGDVHFGGEIYSGKLVCGCGCTYDVKRGVPVLFPGPGRRLDGRGSERGDRILRQNMETWEFVWDKTRAIRGSYWTSRERFEADFPPRHFAYDGRVVLETGIGQGPFIPHLLAEGPKWLFGIDCAETVFHIYDKHAAAGEASRLCIVQGDLR